MNLGEIPEQDHEARLTAAAPVAEAGARLPSIGRSWLHLNWKPAIGWVCAAVLLVEGVVLRIAQLFGSAVQPLSFGEFAPFIITVLGLAGYKTVEKIRGGSA